MRALILTFLFVTRLQAGDTTQQQARERGLRLGEVHYELALAFEEGAEQFRGTAVIRFELSDPSSDLLIDFQGEAVDTVEVDGKTLPIHLFNKEKGVITLPAAELKRGGNRVSITYRADYRKDGVGLHHYRSAQGREYLYTDLQPDAAQRVFPCFDQPDVRGRFSLQLRLPKHWEASGNGPLTRRFRQDDHDVWVFAETPPISTYLFNVVAGEYAVFAQHDGVVPMRLLCRQELAGYLDAGGVFETTNAALKFFSFYFDLPYPFAKYDQSFVPEYNFGAMENPGSVTINERYILGADPSHSEITERDQVLLHEAAHMWFGNMVTPVWWNDLWLNESFASYMEIVALREWGREDYWQIAFESKLSAYREDARDCASPIIRDIHNGTAARKAFDAITYNKGLAALEQLEFVLGPDGFREGIRTYLREFQWSNTTLAQFIQKMNAHAAVSLNDWADLWLKTAGHNTVQLSYDTRAGAVVDVRLKQGRGNGAGVLRTHRLVVAAFAENEWGEIVPVREVPVLLKGAEVAVPQLENMPTPLFFLPNYRGHGFVKTQLDDGAVLWLRRNLHRIQDPVLRFEIVWMFRDMLYEGRMSLQRYFNILIGQCAPSSESWVGPAILDLSAEAIALLPPGKKRDRRSDLLFELCLAALDEKATSEQMAAFLFSTMLGSARVVHAPMLVRLFKGEQTLERYRVERFDRRQILLTLQRLRHPFAHEGFRLMNEEVAATEGQRLIFEQAAPDLEASQRLWAKITDPEVSLAQRRFYLWSFQHHPALSQAFVEPYFQVLADPAYSWTFLESFIPIMFPKHASQTTLKAAEVFLKRDDLRPPVRQLLACRVFDLKRDLRIKKR